MTYEEIMAKHASFDKNGRAVIFMPGHPLNEGRRTQVLRARLVMWEVCGPFDLSFEVHHKDTNKQNDHPDNLELFSSGEHTRHHNWGNKWGQRNRGVPKSPSHRLFLREMHLGKKLTEDHKHNISVALRGKPQKDKTCSLCGLVGSNRNTHWLHIHTGAWTPGVKKVA